MENGFIIGGTPLCIIASVRESVQDVCMRPNNKIQQKKSIRNTIFTVLVIYIIHSENVYV